MSGKAEALALTPGAPRAKEAGCMCPVLDNGHGRGMGRDHRGVMLYVIREDCPMHGGAAEQARREKEEKR